MTSIIIVTDDSGRLRQFRFPGFLPVILVIGLFLFSVGFFWVIKDYGTVKSQVASLDQLKMDNKLKRKQVLLLAQRVDRISRKVSGLKEFDHKLKGMVSTEPETEETQSRGVGGTDFPFHADKDTLNRGKIPFGLKTQKFGNSVRASKSVETEHYSLQRFLETQHMGSDHIPSLWPVRGWMMEGFGCRQPDFSKESDFKSGIHIAVRKGSPVVATAEGYVSNIEWHSSSGWAMTLNHGNGIVTRYTNLKKSLVEKGSYVMKGEVIALVGNSARSKGHSLCYEILLNRLPVNPGDYLPN